MMDMPRIRETIFKGRGTRKRQHEFLVKLDPVWALVGVMCQVLPHGELIENRNMEEIVRNTIHFLIRFRLQFLAKMKRSESLENGNPIAGLHYPKSNPNARYIT